MLIYPVENLNVVNYDNKICRPLEEFMMLSMWELILIVLLLDLNHNKC